jgi:hypothetical protein
MQRWVCGNREHTGWKYCVNADESRQWRAAKNLRLGKIDLPLNGFAKFFDAARHPVSQ